VKSERLALLGGGKKVPDSRRKKWARPLPEDEGEKKGKKRGDSRQKEGVLCHRGRQCASLRLPLWKEREGLGEIRTPDVVWSNEAVPRAEQGRNPNFANQRKTTKKTTDIGQEGRKAGPE